MMKVTVKRKQENKQKSQGSEKDDIGNHVSPTDGEEEGDGTNSESEQEEDQDESKYGANSPEKKAQEYYTAAKFKSYRHHGRCGFYKFLSLPAAGFKKESIKLQHTSQVKTILYHLDPDGNDINCIADEAGASVWHNWVRPRLENKSKAPGTIISYLTSLEKFLTFATMKRYAAMHLPLHQSYE